MILQVSGLLSFMFTFYASVLIELIFFLFLMSSPFYHSNFFVDHTLCSCFFGMHDFPSGLNPTALTMFLSTLPDVVNSLSLELLDGHLSQYEPLKVSIVIFTF